MANSLVKQGAKVLAASWSRGRCYARDRSEENKVSNVSPVRNLHVPIR